MNDYLIQFSERDLQLILDALDFYSRQTTMFGVRADWASLMQKELEVYKVRRDQQIRQTVSAERACNNLACQIAGMHMPNCIARTVSAEPPRKVSDER